MLTRYDLYGCFRLLFSIIYTKIFFRNTRLIRLPFDIRNKNNIELGYGFTSGFGCRIEAFPTGADKEKICIKVGKNVQMNDYVHISAIESVVIGDNVLMASKIFISDHNHGNYDGDLSDHPLSIPIKRKSICKPVVIEDNVWLGESVCILPGVTIGRGSVIGAMTVVTKNIPAYSIAVGVPAKVVKKFNFENNIWEKIQSF